MVHSWVGSRNAIFRWLDRYLGKVIGERFSRENLSGGCAAWDEMALSECLRLGWVDLTGTNLQLLLLLC